ncbi:MAG TPA: aspartate--tRNA ligase, partial [Dehalococcoidia bacterium]|nr:aspartate--tRNA ligase [Dehalococcoidia bacterium]
QLDIEMSFVDEEDIIDLLEELFTGLMEKIRPDKKLIKPFPRLTYKEAMRRYGSDKPDVRFGMEVGDLSNIVAGCDFGVFSSAVTQGGCVRGICAPGCHGYSRKQLNELNELAKSSDAGGLVTIQLEPSSSGIDSLTEEMVKSVAAKHLTLNQVKEIAAVLSAKPGDLLLIVAGGNSVVNAALDKLRLEMGRRLKLTAEDTFAFCFIVDFPLLYWDKELGYWQPMHHPFTSPKEEDIPLLDSEPGRVYGRHYDMVLNGCEIAGGSIRIHADKLQRKVFNLMGYSNRDVDQRFGHLLEAFNYGAPPHGGVAAGIDRILMLMAGEDTIREVIPFPKNQNAVDLLFQAPSPIAEEQLIDLHLCLRED